MNNQVKTALTDDIETSWILHTQNNIDILRGRYNHIFYWVFGSIIGLSIVFGEFINSHPVWFNLFLYGVALPAIALGFYLGLMHQLTGRKLDELARKYRLPLPEVQALAQTVLDS